MTLFQVPILVNGATHSAQQFRMLVRDLARGAEGITEGDDLRVTQLSTPGSGVQIGDGSGVVRGRVSTFQGTYAVCNTGADTVDVSANGGGGTRYDLVVLRVEDPEYEGDLDPVTDEINYFQVIPNVTSTTTTAPDGRTCIPLARLAIPASTSTITNAMITDVRKVANPRRESKLLPQTPATASANITGSSLVYSYFSTAAGWNIAVPPWAGIARIKIEAYGLRLTVNPFYGLFSATFGASLGVQNVTIDDNQSGTRRITHGCADTLTIPDAYRGTTQLLRIRGAGASGNTGTMNVDGNSTFIATVEFEEAPW
ncbi:hypothetical protein [Streptomyces sp. NPDC060366]|uniref:hypothetical protein n=1 Tax=Streptomyces sp. NPDC060366 TaxID=3347105 RepID=UPI00365BA2AC